jgi:hypothetical protein
MEMAPTAAEVTTVAAVLTLAADVAGAEIAGAEVAGAEPASVDAAAEVATEEAGVDPELAPEIKAGPGMT